MNNPTCHKKGAMFCSKCSQTFMKIKFHNKPNNWAHFYSQLSKDKKSEYEGVQAFKKLIYGKWKGSWSIALIYRNNSAQDEVEKLIPKI